MDDTEFHEDGRKYYLHIPSGLQNYKSHYYLAWPQKAPSHTILAWSRFITERMHLGF
jgi:hypothetical protein